MQNMDSDLKALNSNEEEQVNSDNYNNVGFKTSNCSSQGSFNIHGSLFDDSQHLNTNESKKIQQNIKQVFDNDEEEIEDPHNLYRNPVSETGMQSNIPNYPSNLDTDDAQTSDTDDQDTHRQASRGNEVFSIAPGEGRHPVHFMKDKFCEEMAFPTLFPKGKFGYQAERRIPLSPAKYFNARLLNYRGRFSRNPEYLVFSQFITEQRKVQDS